MAAEPRSSRGGTPAASGIHRQPSGERNRSGEMCMTDKRHAPDVHPLPDGGHVAYRFLAGRSPTVVFLCGYGSEMTGTRARYLSRALRGVLDLHAA